MYACRQPQTAVCFVPARPTLATTSPRFDRELEGLVINRMDRISAQAVRFLDNPEIREVITRLIRDQVYDRIQDQSKARAANA